MTQVTLQRTRTIHKSLVVHTKSVVELGVVCMPGIPALRLGQEVGEFQANLGYIADSISKIAKQKNWMSEVGGLRSGLEAASGQGRPEIIAQAEQEPFPEGILEGFKALHGECEGR